MQRSTLGVFIALIAALAIGGLIWATARNGKTTQPTTTNNSADQSTSTQPESNSEGEAQATSQVTIRNSAFSPASIKVKKGTTVTWTNRDALDHTVTPNKASSFSGSGTLGQSDSFGVTFNEVGTFAYHCGVHGAGMAGTVEVTE